MLRPATFIPYSIKEIKCDLLSCTIKRHTKFLFLIDYSLHFLFTTCRSLKEFFFLDFAIHNLTKQMSHLCFPGKNHYNALACTVRGNPVRASGSNLLNHAK